MILETFAPKQFQGKYCLSPFVMIEVTTSGDVRMCGCGSWMPTTIGNLTKTTLQDMLKSELASNIRKSIIDGSYTFCNEKLCGVIANNSLNTIDTVPPNIEALFDDPAKFEMPHHISFQGDATCNLSCPSCRTKIIKTPKEQQAEQIRIGQLVSSNLFSAASDNKIKLETSGTGEVFASEMIMSFIDCIDLWELACGLRGAPQDKSQRLGVLAIREERRTLRLRRFFHVRTHWMLADWLTKHTGYVSKCMFEMLSCGHWTIESFVRVRQHFGGVTNLSES